MSDDRRQPRTEAGWEGGGRGGTAPKQGGRSTDEHDIGRTGGADIDDGNEYNRREVPGGTFHPATTPGGTGPSTRDTARAAGSDANQSLVGRVGVAGDIQVKPQRQEYDPDR